MQFLDMVYLNNSVRDWLIAFAAFLIIFLFFVLLKRKLLRRIVKLVNKTESDFDNFLKEQLNQTRLLVVFFLAIYIGSLFLKLPTKFSDFLGTFTIVVFVLQAAFWGLGLIDFLINRKIQSDHEEEKVTRTTMRALSLVAKIALWGIVVFLILENITGLEMSSLIATLGVGSVAIALAVQKTNLLCWVISSP